MRTVAWFDRHMDRVFTDRQLQIAVAEGETVSMNLVALCYQSDLIEAHRELADMVRKSKEMVQKSCDLICEIESVREEINSLKLLIGHG